MTKTLITAALLWASLAVAASPLVSDSPLAIAQSGGSNDDDDEDDAPASTPTPKPGTPEPKPEDKPAAPTGASPAAAPASTPAAAAPAAAAPTPAAAYTLVSGAPLNNPSVGVHIVEQKAYSDSGRREVVVYPAALQVNGKFTQHIGTQGSFVWHLQENFGLQITGGYNWSNSESGFNSELVEKAHEEAQAATSLLWTWGVLGGVEVTPIYGKFALFEGTLAHFSFVLSGGAGAGGTRHQLKPESTRNDGSISAATYGDTGFRFMGSVGAGFRLQLGEHFAFRIEVRDVVYTARVERVNGCDVNDLKAMDGQLRAGKDPAATAGLSGSCNVANFTGIDEQTGNKRSNDVPLALNLVRNPSSDVLNNVGLYIGASFLF